MKDMMISIAMTGVLMSFVIPYIMGYEATIGKIAGAIGSYMNAVAEEADDY